MKIRKPKFSLKNIFFVVVIALLLIPKTRQPIQIWLNKGLALFSPSAIAAPKQQILTDYNWKLQTKYGDVVNLDDARGRVILVNFWATWCPPCIAEMPSMEALYKDYKGKVVFVFVSSEKRQKINSFLKDKGYSFNSYIPMTPTPGFFDVTSIPRTFLIDKTGHVVIDKTGAANWNSDDVRDIIDRLLKEE